ncbi:MAG TPA: trans-aconitate 2-methyltransferase [Nocardioidaceae bacterium]|nr:trans-aconitate 2-methyltransferase [Nocardioidaceae bacterium]
MGTVPDVTQWDPQRYLTYADERGRPFLDLLARVPAAGANLVADLGCGPGNQTVLLAQRWPGARVTGVDSSPEMIARARSAGAAGVRFETGDVRDWRSEDPVDVLVSNATFQWVPGHLDLLGRLVEQVRPGGWLAFSVPGNFAGPSHALRRQLAARPPYAEHAEGLPEPDAFGPEVYLERLLNLGCAVDAWETTYLHQLTGEDPVFTWISGTSARSILQALPGELRDRFSDELRGLLRAAYPPGPHGVLLPFRRVFVVAQTPAGGSDR